MAVTVRVAPAGQLSFGTAPPSGVSVNTDFSCTVQLKFRGGVLALLSGVPVRVFIQTGSGTLLNAGVQNTNASGLASFSGLQLDTAGSVTLRFQAPGYQSLSQAMTVTGGGGLWAPNLPAGMTLLDELDFSQTVPAGTGERNIAAPKQNWVVKDVFTKITDDGEDAWTFSRPAGVYDPPGTPGVGSSTSFGAVEYPLNNVTEIYGCLKFKLTANYVKHIVSEKLFMFFTNAGQALHCQMSHNGDWFRGSDEDIGEPYEVQNAHAPTLGTAGILEVHFKKGNPGIARCWYDNQSVFDYTDRPVMPSTSLNAFSLNSTMGGGGNILLETDSRTYHRIAIFIK